jgi:hypothetical protein
VLSDILLKVGPNTLDTLAAKLKVDAKWIPGRSIDQERALQMTRCLVRENLGKDSGGYTLHELLSDLRTLDDESRKKFLDLVMPFWVPGEAAGFVFDLSRRPGRWALVMNGTKIGKYTAAAYLLRAFLFKERVGVTGIAGGISEAGETETIEEIYSALTDILGPVDRNEVAEALEEFENPVFVVLPHAVCDPNALKSFQNEFKKIIFVIDAELDAVWAKKIAALPNTAMLIPPVDPEMEKKRYFDYYKAVGLLSKTG